MTSSDIYTVGVPIIFALIAFEVIMGLYQNKSYYHLGDTLGSMGLLAGNIVVNIVTMGTVMAIYFGVYQFRLFDLSQALPMWALWLVNIILIDFVFYWYHRCSHRSRFLWAIHMNHHSSEEMNFIVAFRQAWLGPLSKVPFFMILPLLGFDPLMTLVAGSLSTLWGVLGHTRVVGKLGPLERIFNTPSHHRVHHGSNPQYIDKNYGNFLIIWDRLFSTHAIEGETVVYGLVNNVNTFNPIKITFMGWKKLFRDMWQSGNAKYAIQHFFAAPDWQPKGKISHIEDQKYYPLAENENK